MDPKRKIALATMAFGALAGSSLLLASTSLAATPPTGLADHAGAFAQALATRFNLNVDDVKAFLSDQAKTRHEEMAATMEQRLNERLDQAVSDGKITADQKAAIVAKLAETKAKMDELKDATPAERKTALKQIQEDLKSWADQNGIDRKWLGPAHEGFGRGHRGFGHGMRGMHGKPDQNQAPKPQA